MSAAAVAALAQEQPAMPGGTSPHGSLALPCITCHSADGWRPARISKQFSHARFGFALEAGHAAVNCSACHTALDFSKVQTSCAGCHRDVHSGELGTDCSQCHNTRAFRDRRTFQQRHALSRFPLEGAHRVADCTSCHTSRAGASLAFRGTPTECVACHRAEFDQTTSPSHVTAGFPTDCTGCHTPTNWGTRSFDHNATRFPLTGAHQAIVCQACHADRVYHDKPTACIACHQTSYNGTHDPPHQAAGFSTDCTTCHTTATWGGAVFDHNATQFPLTGPHSEASCKDCHGDGVYKGKSTACVACHRGDFVATTNPSHQAASFPTDCTACHTGTSWSGAVYDHNTTQFPLTGAHQAVPCQTCHGDGVYDGKATTCVSCHLSKYSATTNPAHQAAGFPTTCTICHTTSAWLGTSYDHNVTAFPLTGAHRAASCQACHADGVYDGKLTTCVSCHQTNYAATTNPPHQAAGFPTDCTGCHTTTVWTGAVFNHNSTAFPLTGAHLAATCQACHADGVYNGKPTTCVSCHQSEYNATANPQHQAAGFATTCANCHTTTTWAGAVFDHNTTSFPLTGAHVAVSCQTCHADGVYNGKPTTCVSCHLTAYNGTTNPAHQSAGFPTDCTSCHTTTTWSGATFNHDGPYFPIYSGKHLGRWTTCSQCHNNPAAYSQFTCLTCHEHEKIKMDDTHKDRPGYSYQSTACYGCHPRGEK